VFEGSISDRIALTEVLLSPGGEKLSAEAAQLIAILMQDPKLIPLNALYRDGGEREFPRDSVEGLSKSVSKCHDVNKAIIRDRDEMRQEFNLKLRNRLILTVVGWLPAIAAFVYTLLR
jgi:hypothetical protein